MNKSQIDFLAGLISFILGIIVFGGIMTAAYFGLDKLERDAKAHRQEFRQKIDDTPVTVLNGQKVHIFNNKIYPVVIIENKEQTIYDPPEINK